MSSEYSKLQLDCIMFDLVLQLEEDYCRDAPRDPFGPPPDDAEPGMFAQITAGGTR